MLLWIIIKVSLRSLMANKLRTFLAMLGIIIGVGAVISMLALGAGAKKQVMDRVTAMGTNILRIDPGGVRRAGVRSGSHESLMVSDAKAILEEVEGVEAVSPQVNTRAQIKYYNENTSANIGGVAATYAKMRNFEIESGRNFTSVEEEQRACVTVLGANIVDLLFGEENPLGERVRIGNINFRVIGTLKAKGGQDWYNPDDVVLVPFTTVMKRIVGQRHLTTIQVKASDKVDLTQVEKDITALLHKRHQIRPDGDDDFHLHNSAEYIEMASSVTKTFTILLGGIASISLVVGGIGIMNIMLVTVTERTREIGVRKAIGARDRDILRQFLLESILISGLGGAVGIVLGYAVGGVIGHFSEYQPMVETNSIFLALFVSASVGIFFGYYPARRASRLDPIEALRYE